EVSLLSGTWRHAGEGYARLLALTALVTAGLALKDREQQLAAILKPFATEIGRQILPDGGHVSRSPAVLVELLLDWLPLKACFDGR
ncbi:hypothetical protein ACPXA8_27675, partial [Klebsiella pneumoniae]|uniref:hypothetical protein n=1 Tax=Klebsiella pneumoniae TaxID=573 RepID=UPI003CF4A3B6